jgi:hypothetical protein
MLERKCSVERPEKTQAMRETGEERFMWKQEGRQGWGGGPGKEAGYGETGKEVG